MENHDAGNIIYISVVNNYELYDTCIAGNVFVKNIPGISCVDLDNTQHNEFISRRYNQFLDGYNFSDAAWFVFCHTDWEIKEDITPILEKLDKGALYGPIGALHVQDATGRWVCEFYGDIYEKKRDGSDERLQKSIRNQTGTIVDVLDCQCLIVHSTLVNKYNLRFDERLEFDMYVEDFCWNVKDKYNIITRIAKIKCCHWSQVDTLDDRPGYFKMLKYIREKYKYIRDSNPQSAIGKAEVDCDYVILPKIIYSENRSNIYQMPVKIGDSDSDSDIDDPRIGVYNYIDEGSFVLDVGCACGDLGVVLHEKKRCNVIGMEYNKGSISIALSTGGFKAIHHVDLNCFEPGGIFAQYNKQFDYIVFGDVLEHIYDPQGVLNKFKVFLKPTGYFLISFPNISHASIKLNLLINDWTYTDVGLLDETHIRFFTYKSIAAFLTNLELRIVDMKYTSFQRKGLQPNRPWKELPRLIAMFVYSDPNSFVWQYVVKIAPHSPFLSYTHLMESNLEKLRIKWPYVTEALKKNMRKASFVMPLICDVLSYKDKVFRNKK